MLGEKIIKPATSEWAALILFAPKKDGLLHFGVDYQKLYAVTIRDSYLLPAMDVYSLGESTVSSTVNVN